MTDELRQAFSERDVERLIERRIPLEEAERQLGILRDPSLRTRRLDRPATRGDGIRVIDPRSVSELVIAAEDACSEGRVSKFVPASGAATRMFHSLLTALEASERGIIDDAIREDVTRFFDSLPRLALRHELSAASLISEDQQLPLDEGARLRLLGRILLDETGYGLASRAKGLIPFHDYGSRAATAFEEHLVEASGYAADGAGVARLHFTVPVGQENEFRAILNNGRDLLEAKNGARFDVSFSTQQTSTDTICMDDDGMPFRNADGDLLFRPGGHGALLENLEGVGGDILVVKNIDNVVPESRMHGVVHWKKILVGYLLALQESVHSYLRELDEDGGDEHRLDQAIDFAKAHLSIEIPASISAEGPKEKAEFLRRVLDRPIRVCGMVPNEGEPGGGPFWVLDTTGTASLQIVESAEVDLSDELQTSILAASTHFNPVDLVLGLRDWNGVPFALDRFTDPDAVFRPGKSHESRHLTALERPGLWNGAMAHWITVFVEVPASTFAPVKTIFDLLREEHLVGLDELEETEES